MLTPLRIATRQSPLALWQAEHVKQQLQQHYPSLEIVLVPMTTQGDRQLATPLAAIGGKGLFIKELEQGMLEGKADIAVHSMKDVPVELPPGLEIAAILPREDPRDALVSPHYASLDALPAQAQVGTSSLRRQCQLLERYPNLHIGSLRGNVNTRLRKLDAGEFDAIILASAGLKRLGFADRITAYLAPEQSLPAIGQGIIGIECLSEQTRLRDLLTPLHDPLTALAIRAERAMNAALQGGCQIPIAGYADFIAPQQLRLRGLVGDPTGQTILRAEASAPLAEAESLGHQVAKALLALGANRILSAFTGPAPSPN